MKLCSGIALALVLSVTFGGQADDKWQPPPAPEGWKYVASKDGTYQFLFPKEANRSGTRERNFSVRGIRAKILVNYCILRNDVFFEVQAAMMTSSALSGLKIGDVYDLIVQDDKGEGFNVEGPKEAMIGQAKAREYRLSKDKIFRRMIVLVVKNHFYILNVGSSDVAQLDTEKVETFLKSLVFVPKEVQEAAAKDRAAKAEQTAKESLEKYGFKWTLKLEEMTLPDAPVTGKVCGVDFTPDAVALQGGGQLKFRQGAGAIADSEVLLFLNLKPNESVENRTFEIKAAPRGQGLIPSIHLRAKEPGSRAPKSDIATSNYAMKLTFGAKGSDGTIPGTIYLCTSDTARSFIAGKFNATAK